MLSNMLIICFFVALFAARYRCAERMVFVLIIAVVGAVQAPRAGERHGRVFGQYLNLLASVGVSNTLPRRWFSAALPCLPRLERGLALGLPLAVIEKCLLDPARDDEDAGQDELSAG